MVGGSYSAVNDRPHTRRINLERFATFKILCAGPSVAARRAGMIRINILRAGKHVWAVETVIPMCNRQAECTRKRSRYPEMQLSTIESRVSNIGHGLVMPGEYVRLLTCHEKSAGCTPSVFMARSAFCSVGSSPTMCDPMERAFSCKMHLASGCWMHPDGC